MAPELPSSLNEILVCPDCRTGLEDADGALRCPACGTAFPIVDGVPVVLPSNSIFSAADIARSDRTYFADTAREIRDASLKRRLRRSLPRLTKSWARARFYDVINREMGSGGVGRGLHIGAGEGVAAVGEKIPAVEWIHSDVDLAFRPDLVADAVGLPFESDSFDLVYADSVLEHVFGLSRAVSEIQRVLKVGGLVAVGIPFMYPLHGVPYDFTRLTPFGLRGAFDRTESLFLSRDSGAFVALALQLDARLVNAFQNRRLRWVAIAASRILFSGLKHLDRLYAGPRHLGTAAGLLYVGRKVERPLDARTIMNELIRFSVDMR